MFPQPETASASQRTRVIEISGAVAELRPCGALWLPEQGVLVVSDLHLEKGSAYAARGQMLPPYDTRAALNRIAALIDTLRPAVTVSLGDSFHDRRARPRMAADDVDHVRALTALSDWIWITGNHDPAPPDDLGGQVRVQVCFGPLVLRHEPTPGSAPGEIAGHLHPCARVAGRGRSVRARCFVWDATRMVMPAYGALTGGLNVLDEAFAPLWRSDRQGQKFIVGVIGRDSVYAAGRERLVPDGVRRAG